MAAHQLAGRRPGGVRVPVRPQRGRRRPTLPLAAPGVAPAVGARLFGAATRRRQVQGCPLEVGVIGGTALLVLFIMTRLGYVLSLWNSATIIWLRRRLRWAEEDEAVEATPETPQPAASRDR